VFIQTSQSNQEVFYGGKSNDGFFSKEDQRIRSIPFATRKPTLGEAEEVVARIAVINAVVQPPWLDRLNKQNNTDPGGAINAKVESAAKEAKEDCEVQRVVEQQSSQMSEANGTFWF
jgi:hypothetical protein